MPLICWCGRPLPFAMCQQAVLASAALHLGATLVAIAACTFSGVATEPSASLGRHVEHSATYDTGPAVYTALESHGPVGTVGGVKTVFHALLRSSSCVGSYWFVSGPAVASAMSLSAPLMWSGVVTRAVQGGECV